MPPSTTSTMQQQEEAEATRTERTNRVLMKGMIWNANHVLHLALKQETEAIPAEYFENAKGILLVNVVEVGLILGGSYGTGILLAKKAGSNKWSPPCAIGLKSLGVGSVGTAVRDVIIFLFDQQAVENLASNNSTSIHMEHKGRATLGPLGRHDTHVPHVSSEAIENCAAFSFAKGALVGVTGESASVYPAADANKMFYKTKKKEQEVTPKDILFGSVKVPAKANEETLLPDVYQKLDMLSKGAKYDGTEKLSSRPSMTKAASTSSSSSRSNAEKRPSVTKQTSTKSTNGGTSPRPSVTKSASVKSSSNGASPRPSVTEKRPSSTSPQKRPSTKATNQPNSPDSVTKMPIAEQPKKEAPRPAPTKQESVEKAIARKAGLTANPQSGQPDSIKRKAGVKAPSKRPSIEIKGYNC